MKDMTFSFFVRNTQFTYSATHENSAVFPTVARLDGLNSLFHNT